MLKSYRKCPTILLSPRLLPFHYNSSVTFEHHDRRHFSFQLDSIMKKLFTQFDNHPNEVKSNFFPFFEKPIFFHFSALVTLTAFHFACLLNLDAKFIHLIFRRVMCRESFCFIKFESYTKANFTSRDWNLD
jgi:hypothetical protein